MTITPLELLDTSIAQLQTLVTFLDDQLGWAESAALETNACKEIAQSLRLLIRSQQTQYGNGIGQQRTTSAAQFCSSTAHLTGDECATAEDRLENPSVNA